jgi:excisionase family DNA binding protein
MGIKTAKGYGWTRSRAGSFRADNAIANYAPGERQIRGEFTIEEAAERLGVSYSTVQRMIKRRQLPARQVCPGAPWIIRTEDIDRFRDCGNRPSKIVPNFHRHETMLDDRSGLLVPFFGLANPSAGLPALLAIRYGAEGPLCIVVAGRIIAPEASKLAMTRALADTTPEWIGTIMSDFLSIFRRLTSRVPATNHKTFWP